MKKSVSFLLSACMLFSAGTAVRAEENVMDFEDMGIRMEIPEEFAEFQGILAPEPNGLVSYDPNIYYMTFDYYAMSEDELAALLEKPEDEPKIGSKVTLHTQNW